MEAASQRSPMELPILALVVSGATRIYIWRGRISQAAGKRQQWTYHNVGARSTSAPRSLRQSRQTPRPRLSRRPLIDALAPHGNPRAVPFTFSEINTRPSRVAVLPQTEAPPAAKVRLRLPSRASKRQSCVTLGPPSPREHRSPRDASRRPRHHPKIRCRNKLCDQQTLDLIASFQYAVVGNLQRQTFAAADPSAPQPHRLRGVAATPAPPPLQAN